MSRWGWRPVVGGLAVLSLLATAACEPDAEGETASSTTSVPPGSSSTTTTSTSTTSTSTTSTSTTSTTTTTTTTIPDPGSGGEGLTLQDTGLTRARVTVTSQSPWVTVDLHGVTMDLSRVVSTTGEMGIVNVGGTHISTQGRGTAVIDFVLDVPRGATPSLKVCKHYDGGPASVTVSRTTHGAEVVGSMTNGGTSQVLGAPGTCLNQQTSPISRSALIGPTRWPARRDPRPLVLANYYPWYDQETLGKNFGDQPVGPADTSDAAQVAEAVALAATSGIDGFVVEYEATTALNAHIDHVWNAADARGGFQMATMLDFAILQYRTGLSAAGLDAALAAMAKHADRPSQLEVGGQPVVFLYSSWLVNQTEWAAALSRLQSRTGLRPFVVDDSDDMAGPAQYQYGTNNLPDAEWLARWAKGRRMKLREEPGLTGNVGPLWVAPVSPGYDDTRVRFPSTYVDRNNGVRYEQSWLAALASLPDWILISTWNEYYEQTHVMPGHLTGYRALDQTRARSAIFHTTG